MPWWWGSTSGRAIPLPASRWERYATCCLCRWYSDVALTMFWLYSANILAVSCQYSGRTPGAASGSLNICIAIKSHTKSLFTPHDGVNRLFYIDFPHGLLLIPFQLHSPYHRHASVPSSSLPQTPFPSFRTGLIIPSFTRPINTGTSSGSNCVPAPRSSSLTANSTDMLGL